MIVSVAGRRVRKMCETFSLVAQLLPQSNVKICFTKIQSCTYHGLVDAELRADVVDLLGRRESARRESRAGSPPNHLNRKKISRMTPASVGIICHSLRKI